MIILGIDTAIRCTGYGIINFKSYNNFFILDCGVIKNKQKDLHSECLRRIFNGIKEIITTFEPETVSIEDAFYGRNIKTAMILSLARGAAITAVADSKIPIYTYSPRTAKKALTGKGSGSKAQIATILSSMLNLKVENIPEDSTDALALAICHGQMLMNQQLTNTKTKQI